MRRRQGFTLVELLVSMALIIFIMAILSTAFSAAMTTFRNLKAAGDMAEKLRATVQLLQHDLAADHFEGKKRLSDSNFWQYGPPQQGYFQIYQGSARVLPTTTLPLSTPYIQGDGYLEGTDLDGISSYINVDHALAFTIKWRGNQMGDFLAANAPLLNISPNPSLPTEARYQLTSGNSYSYQWAEVAWFLQPSMNPTTNQQDTTFADSATGSAGVPLWTLYRRQRLAVPDNSQVTSVTYNDTNYQQCLELSCWNNTSNGTLYFNSPTDLTVPQRRACGVGNPLGGGTLPGAFTTITQDLTALGLLNPGLAGADIQLTNVVSFDVRVLTPNTLLWTTIASTPDPFVTLGSQNTFAEATNSTFFNPGIGANVAYNYAAPPWALPSALGTSLGTGAYVFDTWTGINDHNGPVYQQWDNDVQPGISNVIPFWPPSGGAVSVPSGAPSGPIIQAIQISIRIWDYKTNQTRQVTIVQAM